MRTSRLVGAAISTATIAAVLVPVGTATAANAAPVIAGVGAAVAAPAAAPLTPEQAKAAKLEARRLWAIDMRKRIEGVRHRQQGRVLARAGQNGQVCRDIAGGCGDCQYGRPAARVIVR